MATVPTPHPWTAGEDALSTYLDSLTDTLEFLYAPPRVAVYQSAASTLTTAVATALPFDGVSEEIDTDAWHVTAGATTRLTVVTAGRILLRGQVAFVSNATGYRAAAIRLNGATTLATSRHAAANGASTYIQVEADYLATAGDYFELMATQTSGGNLDTIAGAYNTHFRAKWDGTT